jgi:hypothetical protein
MDAAVNGLANGWWSPNMPETWATSATPPEKRAGHWSPPGLCN